MQSPGVTNYLSCALLDTELYPLAREMKDPRDVISSAGGPHVAMAMFSQSLFGRISAWFTTFVILALAALAALAGFRWVAIGLVVLVIWTVAGRILHGRRSRTISPTHSRRWIESSRNSILMVADALTILNRTRVFDYATAHRLPAIYEYDFFVRDGGLMSYGPDFKESFERAASLVDRIFKGAKPADLPFDDPTKYLFVVNLKTAKSIGLELPPNLLALADEVIE